MPLARTTLAARSRSNRTFESVPGDVETAVESARVSPFFTSRIALVNSWSVSGLEPRGHEPCGGAPLASARGLRGLVGGEQYARLVDLRSEPLELAHVRVPLALLGIGERTLLALRSLVDLERFVVRFVALSDQRCYVIPSHVYLRESAPRSGGGFHTSTPGGKLRPLGNGHPVRCSGARSGRLERPGGTYPSPPVPRAA